MSISNLAMVFSGVLFQNQSDQPVEPVKANWFPSKQQSAIPDMSSLDFLKVDLVMEDMLTHSSSLFTLFSKDSNRQGLSSAFAGGASLASKTEVKTKSEEKIESSLPTSAKLSFGSLFGSKGNLAKKSSTSDLNKSQEMPPIEDDVNAFEENHVLRKESVKLANDNLPRQTTRKNPSLVPALPQRIPETVLLADTLEAYKKEETSRSNSKDSPTIAEFASANSNVQYAVTSKPSMKKGADNIPRADDGPRSSQASFKSAQSDTSTTSQAFVNNQ